MERTSPPDPVTSQILLPIRVSPFEKVRLLEKEVIYPQIDARFAFVIERLPERLEIFASFVLIRPENVLIVPEREFCIFSIAGAELNSIYHELVFVCNPPLKKIRSNGFLLK